MKFNPNTVSRPVVSKEVAKLTKVLQKGGHVANTIALETIALIAKRSIDPSLPAC